MRDQSRTREEPVVADVITYVGLDVYQASIAVARLTGRDRTPEIWEIPNDRPARRRLARRLRRDAPGALECCYVACPWGMRCSGS